MASTDARPVPIKNTAYRVTFPLLDADGDLVTGATGLDSEVSKDAGAFADCTNEATEIATSSGVYYLDLTSTEMNADCVAVIVKTSSSGAKTTVLVFYPQESGDIKVDVQSYGGTAGTFASGRPEVNVTHLLGTAWLTPGTAGTPDVNVKLISGDSVAADNAESFFDGTGYAGTNNVIPLVTTTTNLTNAPGAGDFTATMKTSIGTAVAASAVASVTGNVGGNVTGSVGSVVGSVGSVTGAVGSVTAAVTVTGDAATAGTRLLTMIELDGAVYRFTTNALEQAPTGGGAADGSGFTAIPWNPAWDAEVQSECADALTAYGASTLTQTQVTGGAYALNSASFAFNSGLDFTTTQKAATLARVTLTDTVTTYTGNTPQTGDSFARIGATGSGLTSLAPSATALTSATWTGTRAGYLDNLSAGAVPTLAQILAGGDVDGYTLEQTLKLCLAALAGKLSGAATTTVTIRAADDSKARITATVTADGDRTALTLDETG